MTKDNKILRHRACDQLANRHVDAIISRQLTNLVITFGEAKLLKLLAEVYGVTKPESKAG
jgi:hypothetical protein